MLISFLEGVQFLRKKICAFYITALLGIVFIFTNLTPLHLVDSAIVAEFGAMVLDPHIVPNPALRVIPSLREWQGSSGFFTLSSDSRIPFDHSYTAEIMNNSKVCQ